jgi:hypothetical protein
LTTAFRDRHPIVLRHDNRHDSTVVKPRQRRDERRIDVL